MSCFHDLGPLIINLISKFGVSYILWLVPNNLTNIRVTSQNMVLIIHNSLSVGHPFLCIFASLFIFLNLEFYFMSLLHFSVLLSALFDLVCKIRMFLSYFYLFFQPLLFIMELSQAVFQQLSFNHTLFSLKLLLEFSGPLKASRHVHLIRPL